MFADDRSPSRRVATLVRIGLLCAGGLLSAGPAAALPVDDASGTPTPTNSSANSKTTAEYLSDLGGDNAPERLFAARVLRSQLKTALRTEAHSKPGSFANDEARAALVELSDRIPNACLSVLNEDNVVSPCADMLAMLEVTSALPALERRLAVETRKGPHKHLAAAIATLKALPPDPDAPARPTASDAPAPPTAFDPPAPTVPQAAPTPASSDPASTTAPASSTPATPAPSPASPPSAPPAPNGG
jgi:hypothetical protein